MCTRSGYLNMRHGYYVHYMARWSHAKGQRKNSESWLPKWPKLDWVILQMVASWQVMLRSNFIFSYMFIYLLNEVKVLLFLSNSNKLYIWITCSLQSIFFTVQASLTECLKITPVKHVTAQLAVSGDKCHAARMELAGSMTSQDVHYDHTLHSVGEQAGLPNVAFAWRWKISEIYITLHPSLLLLAYCCSSSIYEIHDEPIKH